MNGRATYLICVAGSVAVVVALTTARVVEVLSGHHPTPELNAAFASAVAAALVVLAAGRTWRL